MTLPVAPSQISHSDIMAEFGHPANTQWKLSADGAAYINFNVGDIIKESDFYGKSNTPAPVKIYDYRDGDPMPSCKSTALSGSGTPFKVNARSTLTFTAAGSPDRTGDGGWSLTFEMGVNSTQNGYPNEDFETRCFVGAPADPWLPERPPETSPLSGGLPLPVLEFRYKGSKFAQRPSNGEFPKWNLVSKDPSQHTAAQAALVSSGITGAIFELQSYFAFDNQSGKIFGYDILNAGDDPVSGIPVPGATATITGSSSREIAPAHKANTKAWTVTTGGGVTNWDMSGRSPGTLTTNSSAGSATLFKYYVASIYIY